MKVTIPMKKYKSSERILCKCTITSSKIPLKVVWTFEKITGEKTVPAIPFKMCSFYVIKDFQFYYWFQTKQKSNISQYLKK